MVNPFLTPVGGSRGQFMQPQNQFDFSGWGDRLGKIEEGIAGLTEQFNDFQAPGDIEPEYLGNAAPEPLEQTANIQEPLGGIESLVAEPAPAPMAQTSAPMGGQAQTQSLTPFQPPPTGGTGQLGRHMIISPGHPDFKPMSEEQFTGQMDLWGQRQDYSDFASMAGDVTGINSLPGRKQFMRGFGGGDPRFGHAYEDWQDYAAGYGGSDPSQAMENWMQDYSFDLAPERLQGPNRHEFMQEFQAANPIPLDTTGTSTWYNTYGTPLDMDAIRERNKNEQAGWQQTQQDFESSPEYLQWQQEQEAWQQRQEARGPLSESTIQAMGGQNYGLGRPDINPYISMGMASGTDPTYEGYLDMINQTKENYMGPQTPTTSPNFARPGVGIQQTINPLSQAVGAGITGLASYQSKPALQGPVQRQIQQGIGALA